MTFHKFICIVCVSGAALLLLCGCVRKNVPLTLDNSDPLALDPGIEWAVVHDPYAAYRKTAGYDAPVTAHCRKADILQVTGRCTVRIDTTDETWYAFRDGWLPGNSIDIYSNKFRAKSAAALLLP
jgi:hypothetical protein